MYVMALVSLDQNVQTPFGQKRRIKEMRFSSQFAMYKNLGE